MKTIGLLGGMSWESTGEYYRIINSEVKQRLGGLHSAKVVLYSFDFAEIEHFQSRGDWESATRAMIVGAQKLIAAGADCLVICTNTMHKMADAVSQAITIPLLHIADATALQVKAAGITKIALLGTRFTMEQEFYRGRLEAQFGLSVLVPNETDRGIVHSVIYDQLCLGVMDDQSRKEYQRVLRWLHDNGAGGVILGCTEIGLLISQADTDLKVFDTAKIHALSAVEFALQKSITA
jgi:aspartate racemase